ncbi:hypothetical protein ROLI_012810 [Roseobacter fucihabitans]|uniref:Uncharacterized protein n=1 Tax=Roseobacter fucihabitans TaxID=1537242 RepID=A0ABZ2BS07_9RHOB|nr:VPLPA-CTERM sorting domain-containing protein [Roseobacter litoralis]MBC6964191.1 hypothetical protein [Roseobacter litoralis]
MKSIYTAIVMAVFAGSANAATIITETTDYTDQDLAAGPLFITSSGDFSTPESYSISGSLAQSDLSDSFTAVLGPNRMLENIVVSFSNVGGQFNGTALQPSEVTTSTAITVFFPDIIPTNPPQLGFTINLGSGNSSTNFMNGITALRDDQTWVFGFGIAANSPLASFGSISGDWNVTFDVVDTSVPAVPLPASSLLLIGALAGLGLARRRTTQG